VSKETGLLKSWPKSGPPLLWTFKDAGIGFSGPAVVGNRLYTMGAQGQEETVFALDTSTVKKVWTAPVGQLYTEGHGDGPRCTPTVDGDSIYALAARGNLVCLEASTGKERWRKNMQKDFGGQMMSGWGYCESPLIDGDKLICSPGGSKGTLVALDKKTGAKIWQSADATARATYSSAIVATIGGVKQYIQSVSYGGQDNEGGLIGVAADSGKLLWQYKRKGCRTAVIPTPIYADGYVYFTAGYGAGCDLVKVSGSSPSFSAEAVFDNKNMVNHHGGVVKVGDYVYGYSDGKGWVCQEFLSGKNVWEDKKLGKGSVTFADGNLYCYSENDGTIVLASAAPDGWKENGRFKIPQESSKPRKSGKIWTHPVVANGKLYLRDLDLIFCFDIRDKVSLK
jgi:outer membrane protein assembly factor BamB